jgi:hypothetical protein
MSPFEHFIATYLGPISSAVGLIVMLVGGYILLRIELKFASFKEDLMNELNGKFLHAVAAKARFDGLDQVLGQISNRITDMHDSRRGGRY